MVARRRLKCVSRRSRYHPFYITNSPEGGFGQKSAKEQMKQKVYAGVRYDSQGYPQPTAAGRYCEWERTVVDNVDNYETFQSFFKTLELKCEEGEPAELVWTVEEDTPDVVYYQVQVRSHAKYTSYFSGGGLFNSRRFIETCRIQFDRRLDLADVFVRDVSLFVNFGSLASSVLHAHESGLEDQCRRRGIPVAEERQRRQSSLVYVRDLHDVHGRSLFILEMNRRISFFQCGTNDGVDGRR